MYNLYCLRLFLFVHYIGYIARMSNLLGIIDILDDDGDLHLNELSATSVSAAVDFTSPVTQSSWIPFSGFFLFVLFVVILFHHFLADTFISFYLVEYSFGTFDLGIIVSKMRQYISSRGGFWFSMRKHYFGVSGRSDVPDVLASLYLDTTYFERCPQSISFDYKEIRKRKGCEHSGCPFSVRIAFDRSVGSYVVKLCRCLHTGHVVNLSSIPGHIRFESDLSAEERSQLANFGNCIYRSAIQECALSFIFWSDI